MTETVTISGARSLPPPIKPLTSLSRIDYADTYTLHKAHCQSHANGNGRPSAEQWARASLGNVPDFWEKVAWSWLLRLKLLPGKSEDIVAGWRVGGRGTEVASDNDDIVNVNGEENDWIRLENSSWLADANILFHTTGTDVSFATAIMYKSWVMRYWWALLGHVHRFAVPRSLKKAKAKL